MARSLTVLVTKSLMTSLMALPRHRILQSSVITCTNNSLTNFSESGFSWNGEKRTIEERMILSKILFFLLLKINITVKEGSIIL